ncbi:hypothetical protein D3C71_1515550 [compost metagenome]
MQHISKMQLSVTVIETWLLTELARLHISLAFSDSEKNISTSSGIQRTSQNVVMLMLITVMLQFRAIQVEFKVSPNFITRLLQIRIVGKGVATAVIQRSDAFGLHPYRVNDTHFVYNIDKGWLPIYGLYNPFQCLISRHAVCQLLAAKLG